MALIKAVLASPELLGALASGVAMLLGVLLNAVHRLVASRVKSEALQALLWNLEDAVRGVVMSLEQQVVADLKAAKEDGKLTDEEKAAIKARALASLKQALGKAGLAQLMKLLGLKSEAEADVVLGQKLEAQVAQLRSK